MTTSTINTERLLALADILDKADELHTARGEPTYLQGCYTHPCGTPACALGHWAVANPDRWSFACGTPYLILSASGVSRCAQSEFGLSWHESEEIFGSEGCDFAETAKQAADYIRDFVARHA